MLIFLRLSAAARPSRKESVYTGPLAIPEGFVENGDGKSPMPGKTFVYCEGLGTGGMARVGWDCAENGAVWAGYTEARELGVVEGSVSDWS